MREIFLYNNLVRKKVPFKTVEEGKVRFYSCGPTTYDLLHVGNARALVVGDLFHRALTSLGRDVKFVRNFTDVDDKIIDRAKKMGTDPLIHSQKYIDEALVDMKALNMKPATETPTVSGTMSEIITMVSTLLDKGVAYEVSGEVLFYTPSFKEYGKLSKKDLESLEHGIRVEIESHKRHPTDFVLWKPAKEGEPSWDSPWGKGRPGWHIECSAMAKKYLGDQIDLHHGGVDLIFPHHENEIAQSESANGCSFSNCWCHNEFVNFGSEKMSKSLGNVISIRGFCEHYSGEVLRHLLLSVHYRSKIEWTEDAIEKAISEVDRIHTFVANFNELKVVAGDLSPNYLDECVEDFLTELANDLNLPGALGILFTLIRNINRDYIANSNPISKVAKSKVDSILKLVSESTGLLHFNHADVLKRLASFKKANAGVTDGVYIEKLLQERLEARKNKNFRRADEIRDELKTLNVVTKDNPDGTVSWSYK